MISLWEAVGEARSQAFIHPSAWKRILSKSNFARTEVLGSSVALGHASSGFLNEAEPPGHVAGGPGPSGPARCEVRFTASRTSPYHDTRKFASSSVATSGALRALTQHSTALNNV